MAKKALCLVFAFLLSINSFAAIVSDNDGSAFVTKAEFEALKKGFADQIDNYNASIDEKIDGAIAAYLAGTNLAKNYTLDACKSEIEYPLTFAMKNKLLDWSKWTTNGATPYWQPNYKVYIWGVRNTCNYLINKEFTTSKVINRFYNGHWIDAKNSFKIENMMSNVTGTITIKTCFYNLPTLQYANETYVTFGFVLDQSSTYDRQSRGTGWNTRDKIRASGDALIDFYSGSTTYPTLKVDAIWSWNSSAALSIQSSSTSNEHYLNQYKSPSNGYTEGNNPGNLTYSSSLNYGTSGINFIMNAYDTNRTDASGKRIQLPVAYDNHIYMTNKNNFKKDLQGGSAINATYWNGYKAQGGTEAEWNARTQYTTTWRFGNMISPAWTLEPQFSGYSHDENKRSLLEPHKMYYIVKTPYTDTEIEQIMTNGILLTEADREIKTLELKFNLSSESSTVKKYLVLSRKPIEQMDYTQIATEAASDKTRYYSISKTETMKDPTYTYELSEGENKVYINELEKNDLVYYKILWTTSNNTQATITKAPELDAVGE